MRNSEIIICKNIRLDKDYRNVLDYTESDMLTLCREHAVGSRNNYSFIKPGKNEIDVSFSYNDCLKCNYMAFQNPYYSNKWFFAFIDNVEYRSESSSRIYFTIDEYSTWFDYWDPKACFVIREHANSDIPGENTQPEGLETGEYIIRSHSKNTELAQNLRVILATPVNLNDSDLKKAYGGEYNGIYSSVIYYSFNNYLLLNTAIRALDEGGKAESLTCLFIAPAILCHAPGQPIAENSAIPFNNQPIEIQDKIYPLSTIGNYTPRNKKLLTYPYVAVNVSNGQGGNAVYQQELFTLDNNGRMRFQIEACITPGCSIRLYPIYYKGEAIPYDESLTLGKYPTLNWTGDPYTNWLTQNSVNNTIDVGTGFLKMVGGTIAMPFNPLVGVSLMGSGIMDIGSSVKTMYEHSLIPPTAKGNINSGDIMTANLENTFHYYNMSIKEEYARVLDDYFDKYGYKTNRCKIPNQIGRTYWNFVQIGSSEDIGYSTNNTRSVPASSMLIINNIYRNGVTIWHSHDNLGDYSLNNSII